MKRIEERKLQYEADILKCNADHERKLQMKMGFQKNKEARMKEQRELEEELTRSLQDQQNSSKKPDTTLEEASNGIFKWMQFCASTCLLSWFVKAIFKTFQFSKFSKMNLFQSILSSRTLNGLHNLTWQLINSDFFCRKFKELTRIPWPLGNKGVNRVPNSIFIWIYIYMNIRILSRFQGYILHFWKAKI